MLKTRRTLKIQREKEHFVLTHFGLWICTCTYEKIILPTELYSQAHVMIQNLLHSRDQVNQVINYILTQPAKTSPAAKSEEKRLCSQAKTYIHTYLSIPFFLRIKKNCLILNLVNSTILYGKWPLSSKLVKPI